MTFGTGHKLVESADLDVDPRALKREVRRLVTPKSVSEYRAKIASKSDLPEGVIPVSYTHLTLPTSTHV